MSRYFFQYTYALLRPAVLPLLISLSTLFSTCRPETVDPGFGPNGEPRLLGVTLSGIPAENIIIDNVRNQVVVTIPTSLSATGVLPTLQLTPNTAIDYTNSSIYSNDKNLWVLDKQTLRLVTDEKKATTYHFLTTAAADMAFAAYTGPVEVSMEMETSRLCLPVYNFRDSVACGRIGLTNVVSGRKREFFVCPSSTCSGDRRSDGAIYLSLLVEHSFVDPGEYTVSVRKDNGRTAILDKTIVFRKGRLALSALGNLSPVVLAGSPSFVLTGYNLYSDSNLSLRLTSPSGQVYASRLEQAGTDNTAALFSTPAGLKPGYYYAQLLQNGEPTTAAVRVVVTDKSDALFIRSIANANPAAPNRYLLTADAPFSAPIVLQRGQTYNVVTSVAEFAKASGSPVRPRLRLLSSTNPAVEYSVEPQVDASTAFTMPTLIPAGRYRLSYQQVQENGVFDALPLEREVVVE